jgi:cytoskeleton protein RodZ
VAHPLLKKSDHKREEPKLGEPKLVQSGAAPEIPIAQALTGESVADTLIRARQQLGQDLRSIAEVLCIRYSYLDAIERGQYENLPGPTYAVGFMRTYADYLGLDGDLIVERFKNEVEGLDSQTKLHFPTPAPEGKMPGGAVFLVAALLFAGAYGVWFYLSNQGESLGDLVAPVPEQLQQMVDGGTSPAESPAPATPAPVAQDPAAPQAGSPVAETPAQSESAPAEAVPPAAMTPSGEAPAAPGEATPPAVVEAPQPESPQPESPPAARGAAGQNPVPATEAPAAQAPAAPAAPADQGVVALRPSAPQADQPATASAPEAPTTETSAETPAAPPTSPYAIPAAPDGGASATAFLMNHQPTVYGEENADARVVLKATQDAWVQVRDREGNLLLTRVLRVGDSYKVPNQADLTLLTGNAGGLEISVDGGRLPALGPVGAVRRNIPLDPEALRSGAGQQP